MKGIFSRRTALAGLFGLAAAPAAAANGPPRFETASRQFTQVRPPRLVSPLDLISLDGRNATWAPRRGEIALLNFWATWCPACVRELPILERLHVAAAKEGVQVVAISVDRDGRERVPRYLQKIGVRRLPVYLDPDGKAAFSDRQNVRGAPFGLYGMPITYIVDKAAHVAGYLAGEADWLSPEARSLLDYYRAGPRS